MTPVTALADPPLLGPNRIWRAKAAKTYHYRQLAGHSPFLEPNRCRTNLFRVIHTHRIGSSSMTPGEMGFKRGVASGNRGDAGRVAAPPVNYLYQPISDFNRRCSTSRPITRLTHQLPTAASSHSNFTHQLYMYVCKTFSITSNVYICGACKMSSMPDL